MPQKKILVVDDDPTQTKLLQGVLTQNGYAITVAQEAADGLNIAIKSQPDLILLDVMMPVINGYNFCRLLKQEKKHIPVILLTSRDDVDDIKIGKEMGADVYLTKPVDTEILLKELKRLLP